MNTTASIELIKQLRQATGVGVLDCRKALEQAGLDYDKALEGLRAKALIVAAQRADRPATQGVVELYSHGGGRIGVMVEINTETDFARRSLAFNHFAHELALHIAAAAPQWVSDEDIPAEVIAAETDKALEKARLEGKPQAIWPRIVEGVLKKFHDQNVLLRQAYIRDETVTVAGLLSQIAANVGENIVIRRFVRWELGEGQETEE